MAGKISLLFFPKLLLLFILFYRQTDNTREFRIAYSSGKTEENSARKIPAIPFLKTDVWNMECGMELRFSGGLSVFLEDEVFSALLFYSDSL